MSESSTTGEARLLDLTYVLDRFERSTASSDDDVDTDLYLEGYTELNKFFSLMGTVFGFVSSDLVEKIGILRAFRERPEDADRFTSFGGMLTHEKQSGLLKKSDYVSGSRTLLRLHRGLDFIREFLRTMADLQPGDKTHTCCQAAYNQTLAAHHPWLVRKGALVAMYTMPTRDMLLGRVCADVQAAVECLPRMLAATAVVFERTDRLYTVHELHALP